MYKGIQTLCMDFAVLTR